MLYRWLCSFMQGMRHTPHQQNMTSFVMSLGCLDLDCAFSGGYAKDPYLTSKIKRYGDYILDLLTKPLPLEEVLAIPFQFSALQTAE